MTRRKYNMLHVRPYLEDLRVSNHGGILAYKVEICLAKLAGTATSGLIPAIDVPKGVARKFR